MLPLTLHIPVREAIAYINWAYFYHTWMVPPHTPVAEQLRNEAEAFLNDHINDFQLLVRFCLFPCNSDGDDIILWHTPDAPSSNTSALDTPLSHPSSPVQCESIVCSRLHPQFRLSFLRQQHPGKDGCRWCLSDFVKPLNDRSDLDHIGIFAATASSPLVPTPQSSVPAPDPLDTLLPATLADRLAEAAIEKAHETIRKDASLWGYAPDEHLTIAELHAERFQGIRPAVGYPSLPDQRIIFDLDKLIDFSAIGITLTETGCMIPHSSVCGLMFAHPQAHYFSVGEK